MPDDGGGLATGAALGGTGIFGLLAVALGLYEKFWRRRNEVEDKQENRLDKALSQADEATKVIITELREALQRCQEQIKNLEIRCNGLRADFDKSQDGESAWKMRCGALLHELYNTRTQVNLLSARANLPETEWFDETLPSLENIKEDNIRRRDALIKWRLEQKDKEERPWAGTVLEEMHPVALGQTWHFFPYQETFVDDATHGALQGFRITWRRR